MRRAVCTMTVVLSMMGVTSVTTQARSNPAPFRPPAVPLVTVDPYFSVWSMASKLTDATTCHWTGAAQALGGLARIDGKSYRFSGPTPADIPAMDQVSLRVEPTETVYQFRASGVSLTVTFLTPLLLNDPQVMARPASYVSLEAASYDGKKHDVALYMDVSADWVVNDPDQEVRWNRNKFTGHQPLTILRIGSQNQPVLERAGDNVRIDWGYLYLVFQDNPGSAGDIASVDAARGSFLRTGSVPTEEDLRMPRRANDEQPVLACSMSLGDVGKDPVHRLVTLIYDDLYSVQYFHRKLRPYWRRSGEDVETLIVDSMRDFTALHKRCERFDDELVSDARRVGGDDYADIVSLAYRQAIAAHKLVATSDGKPLLFSKENSSGACMATVDVSYPASPIFLLFNPDMLRDLLDPIFQYAASPMWPNDFAPHDVGLYPLANGQYYGGGPDNIGMQMPVEETGNMLIMVCALAHAEGNASYAQRYWDVLTEWAAYLKAKGLDPENQLCTDDFAGHLAHNTNLSIKAILGLACYSRLAEMLGKKRVAAEYWKTADEMAAKWETMARDGDHYELAFDQPGTWSMKYNLVWDKILDLGVFDPSIAKTEVAFYKKRMNTYGLPLDSRKTYTKADWLVWTATLAGNESDFEAFISPLRKFLDESPDRVPFSDWYETTDGKAIVFRARSVVGGVFIKMLSDDTLWKKWRSRKEPG